MTRSTKYPQEIRERAVRMVFEHEPEHPSQWATIRSVSSKFGMSAETLRSWVRQVERDQGRRPGLTTTEREEMGPARGVRHRDRSGPRGDLRRVGAHAGRGLAAGRPRPRVPPRQGGPPAPSL